MMRCTMCDYTWERRGDKWVLVLAEEDEIFEVKEITEDKVDEFEFPPIKPAVEETHTTRRPRALMR